MELSPRRFLGDTKAKTPGPRVADTPMLRGAASFRAAAMNVLSSAK